MNIETLFRLSGAAMISGLAVFIISTPASALTMTECSAKYQAAKDAGTLGGVKWNDFRKTQCADTAASTTEKPAKTKSAKPDKADTAQAKGLTMQECSAKYKSAQESGLADGVKWNAFRKSECGPGSDPNVVKTVSSKEPPAPTISAPRGVTFPSGIAGKYSSEKPGKARLHTCLDQYYANKSADRLNGLRWIQKGGGYYSLCNARLKASS